mgnify:CR=1 FL=1
MASAAPARFVTVVLAQGLSNSFPVFLLPISDELGGLRSLSAAVFSVTQPRDGPGGNGRRCAACDALGERRIMRWWAP